MKLRAFGYLPYLPKGKKYSTTGIRLHGKHGNQGPRMPVAKPDDYREFLVSQGRGIPNGYQEAVIPEREISVPKFKMEDPEVSCSRCDFGTGSHACWRGNYKR